MAIAIVAGPLANKPRQGGAAWVPVSWALGLRRLGFDVWFIEQISSAHCLDASGRPVAVEESENLAFFARVARRFRLPAALVVDDGITLHGATWEELLEAVTQSSLLLNVSGHLSLRPLFERAQLRVFLDLDPGFTQFWACQGLSGARLEGHHAYYTIAENIGASGCRIPTVGIDWRTTRNPVILEEWPAVAEYTQDAFTTTASWRPPYGPVEFDGRMYGLKVHEFRKFMGLPRVATGTWELALDIDPADEADRSQLLSAGWRLVDPRLVAGDPDSFKRYVQRSLAEFSVAQGMYVDTVSGWFSDRTTRYLASGKPALVQDTGFSASLPVGEGLVAFRSFEEAVEGAASITRDYCAHANAAREIARSCFDSDRVIGRLLEELEVRR